MATLCSLFQQPRIALLIGLVIVLDPWIWDLAAVVWELLPPFPSHLQPTALSISALATFELAYASRSSTPSRTQWTCVVLPTTATSLSSRSPCRPLCHPKKSLRVSLLLAGPHSAWIP